MVLQLVQFVKYKIQKIRIRHEVRVMKGVGGHAKEVNRGVADGQWSTFTIKRLAIVYSFLRRNLKNTRQYMKVKRMR